MGSPRRLPDLPVPAGVGLLAFESAEEAAAAIEEVNRDYERHSREARRIAVEYFGAAKP